MFHGFQGEYRWIESVSHGIEDVLPYNIDLIHGPGCPVCVLPIGRIDEHREADGQRDAPRWIHGATVLDRQGPPIPSRYHHAPCPDADAC